jgi:putative phosphoribosyl transferase
MFDDRAEAARMIADLLAQYRGHHPLVLAIPRGAVPMGRIIAEALDGDLDVVLVRKLRAPCNAELAIGSIDERGAIYLDPEMTDLWTDAYLQDERDVQLKTLRARREQYDAAGAPIDAAGRIVIVLDDGIATGSTMIAALRAVRSRRPARLIAAAAVAAAEALRLIHEEADDVVCAETPAVLFAIGCHFRDFSQVSDDEVIAELRASRRSRPMHAAAVA